MMNNETQANIHVTWSRDTGKVDYDLHGMTHIEAQRILMAILKDCFEHALAEVHHPHDHHHPHPEGNQGNPG